MVFANIWQVLNIETIHGNTICQPRFLVKTFYTGGLASQPSEMESPKVWLHHKLRSDGESKIREMMFAKLCWIVDSSGFTASTSPITNKRISRYFAPQSRFVLNLRLLCQLKKWLQVNFIKKTGKMRVLLTLGRESESEWIQ